MKTYIGIDLGGTNVRVAKVDEEGNLIAGAKLAIYDSTGKKIQEFTSKSTPTSIKKLAIGNYTLKELEAPSGYQLNPNPVSFQVTATTQNLQITMKNVKKVERAAKLVDASKILENGILDSKKLEDEINAVLAEFPELKNTTQEEKEEKGFKFGATEGTSNASQKTKKSIPTKRWNRFNSFK